MTNADHIRAMSVDELLEMLFMSNCPPGPPSGHCWDKDLDCKECWLKWLKQPYEEDDE